MGKPFDGPNDATLDGKGRIYFTDLAGSAVYRLDPLPNGGVSSPVRLLAAPTIQRSNGIRDQPHRPTAEVHPDPRGLHHEQHVRRR
jgi:sugar lactone lactonase YvrE